MGGHFGAGIALGHELAAAAEREGGGRGQQTEQQDGGKTLHGT